MNAEPGVPDRACGWSFRLDRPALKRLRLAHRQSAWRDKPLCLVTAENRLDGGGALVAGEVVEDLSQDRGVVQAVAGAQQERMAARAAEGVDDLEEASPEALCWSQPGDLRRTYCKLLVAATTERVAEGLYLAEWSRRHSRDASKGLWILSSRLVRQDLEDLGLDEAVLLDPGGWLMGRAVASFARQLARVLLQAGGHDVPAECPMLYCFPPVPSPAANRVTASLLVDAGRGCGAAATVYPGPAAAVARVAEAVRAGGLPCAERPPAPARGAVSRSALRLAWHLLKAWPRERETVRILLPCIPRLAYEALWYRQVLAAAQPKLVVQGVLADPLDPLRNELVREHGGKTVLVTGGWFEPERAHNRFSAVDGVCAWGEYHREMFLARGMAPGAVCVTGRLRMTAAGAASRADAAPVVTRPGRKRIVFLSQKFNHPLYHPPRADAAMLRLLCRWATSRRDVSLEIKPHPTQTRSELAPFEAMGDSVTVVWDVVDCCDLVRGASAVGTFFSTALVEVLELEVPCFQLDLTGARPFLPLAELDAAILLSDPDRVGSQMERLLDDEELRARLVAGGAEARRYILGPSNGRARLRRALQAFGGMKTAGGEPDA